MKTVLKIATVLTWINLVLWGIIAVVLVLGSLAAQAFVFTAAGFLLSSIPLNCYAALQLHKSIRHPAVKLSSQTPVGIRFVGFIALFFGIMMITNSISNIQNPREILQLTKDSLPGIKGMEAYPMTESSVRRAGIIVLLLGLSVVVNILLNFRLLRWYYLVRQSDVS